MYYKGLFKYDLTLFWTPLLIDVICERSLSVKLTVLAIIILGLKLTNMLNKLSWYIIYVNKQQIAVGERSQMMSTKRGGISPSWQRVTLNSCYVLYVNKQYWKQRIVFKNKLYSSIQNISSSLFDSSSSLFHASSSPTIMSGSSINWCFFFLF